MTTPHPNAALREKLIDMIAEHLSGTYRCLRVWEALGLFFGHKNSPCS
jgi:hypothetical protein